MRASYLSAKFIISAMLVCNSLHPKILFSSAVVEMTLARYPPSPGKSNTETLLNLFIIIMYTDLHNLLVAMAIILFNLRVVFSADDHVLAFCDIFLTLVFIIS